MYLLGCDIGSSSVKASIVDSETGLAIGSDFFPREEAPIVALHPGWAEQDPEDWWTYLKAAIRGAIVKSGVDPLEIGAIGISYQMHGLVVVDKNKKVLRPSLIWCDSRSVLYGEQAFRSIGERKCLTHLLNSPGNFTAAKLAWIKEHEPKLYESLDKIMLPGDFIALRMTGDVVTTVSGLSEGIFWDFMENKVSDDIMNYFGFDHSLIPDIYPTFGVQGELLDSVASELGLRKKIPVTYRAGDQPNNGLSLNVLNPGEIAATGGTSGVVYGINDQVAYDPQSRVNTFAHVNHSLTNNRLGVLLCINGVGILNSWIKKNIAPEGVNYDQMNEIAYKVPIGSEGLSIIPFGNGAERMLENKETSCSIHGLNFNIHNKNHLIRAAHEGIVFSFKYGMDIMNSMGMNIEVIRAGKTNMFLSPVFTEALAGVTGSVIELYDTNGAVGAAKGAGIGAGIYSSAEEAFSSLKKLEVVEPDGLKANEYCGAFDIWKEKLDEILK